MWNFSGSATPEISGGSYILDNSYRPSLNGHPDSHSPSSSIQGSDAATLTRTQKQPPSQQVRGIIYFYLSMKFEEKIDSKKNIFIKHICI